MLDISFEYDIDSLQNAYEKEVTSKIHELISNAIKFMKCPNHDSKINVTIKGNIHDDFDVLVEGYCPEFEQAVGQAITNAIED